MRLPRLWLALLTASLAACGGRPAAPAAPTAAAFPSAAGATATLSPVEATAAAESPTALPGPVAVEYAAPRGGYEIGSPIVVDVWVDGAGGDDLRSGASRGEALRTLTEAWNRVPRGVELSVGYRIRLAPGVYPEAALPSYLEARHGTAQFPVIIQAADGPGTVILAGDLNIYDTRYLYLLDLDVIPEPAGDVIHCEQCDHFLIRNAVLDGGGAAHETLKANQSQYLFIEYSDISGSYENAIDFVAVQYAHIIGNRLHHAEDWCAYVKGGSAYIRVEGNEIYDCGTGGFTAGQGTGFQYLVAPWIQFEAYDIKVVNNLVHDVAGACLGVNGGYNILLAHNTCVRTGARSHVVEFVFGARSCDGQPGDPGREGCGENLTAGGWGTTVVDNGDNFVRIPNRNVFFYNNLIYNPPGYQSQWQVFSVAGPYGGVAQSSSNAPAPALADEDLQVRGNLIWDGGPHHPLGVEDAGQGCQPANTACSAGQLRAENAINTVEPQVVDAAGGNFQPVPGGSVFGVTTFAIPDFTWDDSLSFGPVPEGDLSNAVTADYQGQERTMIIPGALQ